MAALSDLLIAVSTIEEGLLRLTDMLEIMRRGELTLNPQKYHFIYLGIQVSGRGIKPLPKSIHVGQQF